ncbi:MAG: helix-turn-helix transcriptional regulator [Treponema sp.]|nr:helix-turn-helix transcriptional regulator [Treponema sp.]
MCIVLPITITNKYMSVDYFTLGQRIQARRKSLKKTQEMLAEELSVTVGYISQIERGVTKVNLETLDEIAQLLGCTATDFLDGTTKTASTYLSEDLKNVFTKLTAQNKKILLEIAQTLLHHQ